MEPGEAVVALLAAADALIVSAVRDVERGQTFTMTPPLQRLYDAASAAREHADQVATWGARVEEVYRLLGRDPGTSWGDAMEELLSARAGARHYADLALKLEELKVRADNMAQTLVEWRNATGLALERGLNAVGAAEVVKLLGMIVQNFESGSLLPLTTSTTCQNCGQTPDLCVCDAAPGVQ